MKWTRAAIMDTIGLVALIAGSVFLVLAVLMLGRHWGWW